MLEIMFYLQMNNNEDREIMLDFCSFHISPAPIVISKQCWEKYFDLIFYRPKHLEITILIAFQVSRNKTDEFLHFNPRYL